MLTAIREGSKGWLSAIIIGAIVLTFALFGISSYLEGGEEIPVAVVNGEEISPYTYQNQLAQQRQAMVSRFGGNIDSALLDSLGIKDQVLESLIQNRLIDQYTTSSNYRLSDAQLAERIQQNPLFQTDGGFDPELYQRVIASNGLSPQGYEAIERRTGLTLQLEQAVSDSAFAVSSEVDRLLSLQHQVRDAEYALIPGDRFIDEFEVTEEQARKHYEENIDRYQNPARMRVEYIDLNLESIADNIEPSEQDIIQTYERMKGQLTQPEVRKASHILFAVNKNADDAERQAVREKAESVLAEARGGADFAELAKTHSDDPGSAANGGDLGIVTRGQMVKPFEEAVYSMALNDISEPVETQFGFHIIKLTEFTEQRQKTLDEVRDDVVQQAAREQAEVIFADLVEPLQNLVFEQPDSLVAAADETGLEVQTSDWFTQGAGQGIALEGAVRRAAFSPDVRDENLNSPVIELGFERMVALRKLEYEEQSAQPFEEVYDQIVNQLKLEQSEEKVAALGEQLLADLSHKASWDIMLAENELRAEELAGRRAEIEPQLSVLAQEIYSIPPPEGSHPRYGHVVLPDGKVALYALKSVSLAAADELTEADRERLAQLLTARDGGALFRQFVGVLRDQADVVINEEQL